MSPLRGLLIVLSLMALAALVWICVFNGAPAIEAQLLAQSRAELADGALPTEVVHMDGRVARLVGRVADTATAEAIAERVRAVYGVRVVADELEVEPPTVTEETGAPDADARESDAGTTEPDPTAPEFDPSASSEPDPTARQSDEDAAQAAFDAVLSTSGIEFETGSAVIGGSGAAIVDELAAILNRYPTTRVRLEGHTDSVGEAADNLALSEARASAVATALTARGIEAARLVPIGFGETRPIADNATADGRGRNRRVAFVVVED